MDNETIKKIVRATTNKKVKSYTYIIGFFLLFSFFIFFAIRPSLITALSLSKEEEALREINNSYEKTIVSVLNVQEQIQTSERRLNFLEQALPDNPDIAKLLSDIRRIIQENNISVSAFGLGEVNLIEKAPVDGVEQEKLHTVEITMEANMSYEQLKLFLEDLAAQRRIKKVSRVEIGRSEGISTDSAQLKVNLTVLGYHL